MPTTSSSPTLVSPGRISVWGDRPAPRNGSTMTRPSNEMSRRAGITVPTQWGAWRSGTMARPISRRMATQPPTRSSSATMRRRRIRRRRSWARDTSAVPMMVLPTTPESAWALGWAPGAAFTPAGEAPSMATDWAGFRSLIPRESQDSVHLASASRIPGLSATKSARPADPRRQEDAGAVGALTDAEHHPDRLPDDDGGRVDLIDGAVGPRDQVAHQAQLGILVERHGDDRIGSKRGVGREQWRVGHHIGPDRSQSGNGTPFPFGGLAVRAHDPRREPKRPAGAAGLDAELPLGGALPEAVRLLIPQRDEEPIGSRRCGPGRHLPSLAARPPARPTGGEWSLASTLARRSRGAHAAPLATGGAADHIVTHRQIT